MASMSLETFGSHMRINREPPTTVRDAKRILVSEHVWDEALDQLARHLHASVPETSLHGSLARLGTCLYKTHELNDLGHIAWHGIGEDLGSINVLGGTAYAATKTRQIDLEMKASHTTLVEQRREAKRQRAAATAAAAGEGGTAGTPPTQEANRLPPTHYEDNPPVMKRMRMSSAGDITGPSPTAASPRPSPPVAQASTPHPGATPSLDAASLSLVTGASDVSSSKRGGTRFPDIITKVQLAVERPRPATEEDPEGEAPQALQQQAPLDSTILSEGFGDKGYYLLLTLVAEVKEFRVITAKNEAPPKTRQAVAQQTLYLSASHESCGTWLGYLATNSKFSRTCMLGAESSSTPTLSPLMIAFEVNDTSIAGRNGKLNDLLASTFDFYKVLAHDLIAEYKPNGLPALKASRDGYVFNPVAVDIMWQTIMSSLDLAARVPLAAPMLPLPPPTERFLEFREALVKGSRAMPLDMDAIYEAARVKRHVRSPPIPDVGSVASGGSGGDRGGGDGGGGGGGNNGGGGSGDGGSRKGSRGSRGSGGGRGAGSMPPPPVPSPKTPPKAPEGGAGGRRRCAFSFTASQLGDGADTIAHDPSRGDIYCTPTSADCHAASNGIPSTHGLATIRWPPTPESLAARPCTTVSPINTAAMAPSASAGWSGGIEAWRQAVEPGGDMEAWASASATGPERDVHLLFVLPNTMSEIIRLRMEV